jgi:two-component system cell cycle sensor histidine kinase/response regulator CckA
MGKTMENSNNKSKSRWPMKALTVSLVFTIVLFVVFGYLIWDSYRDHKTTELANLRSRELNGIILHLDEVLTMSARMAAATGNMQWAERYLYFEPLLDDAIKEAKETAPETFMTEAAAMTDAANVKLVAMEKRSFNLIQAGNREAAGLLLSSENYEKEKMLYHKGIAQISADLDNRIQSSVENQLRQGLFAVISVVVVVPVLTMIWLLVARTLNNYIADLNRTEEALRESEKRYRTLIAKMINGFALHEIICDEVGKPCDYRFIEVNSAFEKITGLKTEEIVGKTVLEILPQTESYWIENFGKVALTGESIQMEKYSREFGKYFEVLVYSNQIGQFATVFTDRTEQRKAKEALQLTQFTIDRSSDASFWMGSDGRFIYVNDAACRALGYSREELLSLTVHDIDLGIPREIWLEHWSELKRQGSLTMESNHRTQDGRTFPVETVANFVKFGDKEYNCAFVRDITERNKMQDEFLKAQKLESIGILAGGMAHDFNNLLSIIMGNIDLVKDQLKPSADISALLAETEKASFQAQALTQQLTTFSKGGAPATKLSSIKDLVHEIEKSPNLGSNITCEISLAPDLWFVEFDEGQMKHAINNLIVNAIESMPDGGRIHVLAENFNLTARGDLLFPEGRYIRISIRDQGGGIPEGHRSQIFDPYFSTKEMGLQKGMGLGLTTTYSIINRHDGYITVESEVGVGTTFTIILPAPEKDIRESEPSGAIKPEAPSTRTGKILLMDDEEMIRDLGQRILSRLEYDPELAADGNEAIEMYRKAMDSGNPFEIVILDLTVKGGLGGKDAAKKILKMNPHAKVIVSSGYSNDPVMIKFREYGFIAALPKPYKIKDMINVLKKVTS